MKLTFFLIALALVLLRLCYPTLELWHNGRGQGTMITKSDNYYEGIWWSGKYRISDDDRSIAELSPGGYLKFRENDTTMKVESDLQGRISYKLNNGHEELPMDDSGRNFVAAQLQKMIRLGFFGEDRAERIYRQGGVTALLTELSRIRMEGGRDPYLKMLFRADTLTSAQRIALLRLIDNSNDNGQRQHLLEQFSQEQLRDSAFGMEWLITVGHIDASYMKKDLLLKYIDSGVTPDRFDTVLAITSRFNADYDQQEVYKAMTDLPPMRMHDSVYARPWLSAVGQLGPAYMKKDLLLRFIGNDTTTAGRLDPALFDSVVAVTRRCGSDVDKQDIYKRLTALPGIGNPEWAALIGAAGALPEDYMKSDLLIRIAKGLPRQDSLINLYRMAAKSIQSDFDYGKTIRAIE
jgi:hypothetical protein